MLRPGRACKVVDKWEVTLFPCVPIPVDWFGLHVKLETPRESCALGWHGFSQGWGFGLSGSPVVSAALQPLLVCAHLV